MADGGSTFSFTRFQQHELAFCRRCTAVAPPMVIRLLRTASRLGDGTFWVAMLALAMLLEPGRAMAIGNHLVLVAAVAVVLYKGIKHLTARPRPCAERGVHPWVEPLDRYSFPSGHTLHAVAFSLALIHHVPLLAWVAVPFACLVAISRVALGVHYPTDVAAGAILGALVARLSLLFIG